MRWQVVHLLVAPHAQQHAGLGGVHVLAEGEGRDAARRQHRPPRLPPAGAQQHRRVRPREASACRSPAPHSPVTRSACEDPGLPEQLPSGPQSGPETA